MKMLNEAELEMIAGGIMPIFTLGPDHEPTTTDEPRDGGATGGW